MPRLNRRVSGAIDNPKQKRAYVRELFTAVAGRYDLTNDVLSLGLHRRWKSKLVRTAGIRSDHRVLDLAAGTGDLAFRAAALTNGTAVVAADLTPTMMALGQRRGGAGLTAPKSGVVWAGADAAVLPFRDGYFDRVLIGYGLRNFADLPGSLAEIARCLRPGGRLAALDFGLPRSRFLRAACFAHLELTTRIAGWLLHRDAESYVYIPESLRRFPEWGPFQEMLVEAGFKTCQKRQLALGGMSIFTAVRAAAPTAEVRS